MQSSFESHGQFERKISVEIPAQDIDSKITLRLKDIAKNIKMPGFRKGKTPMSLLQGRYGSSVRQEVLEEVINQALRDVIVQEKVTPANTPHVHMENDKPGEALKFYAHFEVYPEVKLNDLSAIHMDIAVPVVDDAAIADVLTRIQKAHAQWEAIESPAQIGHRVTVDFTGRLLGEETPFTDEKGMQIILGDNRMIPGFEDALLDLKAGEHKQFMVTFPKNYAAHLADKRAEFSVEVTAVENGTLAEITDEFCKETLSMTDGSVEQLKEKIRENLTQEASEKVRRSLHKVALEKFAAANSVEVPPSLIKEELKVLKDNLDDPKLPQALKDSEEKLQAEAAKRVLYSLLLGQFIRDHHIQVDQKKVQQAVMNMARSSQDPEGVLRWFFEDKSRLNPVSSLVLEEQALDHLLEQVSRHLIDTPYKEIMAADTEK